MRRIFESKKMDTPNEQNYGPIKVIEIPIQTDTPGSKAAKISIIAALAVIGLNVAGVTILKGRPEILTATGIAAIAAVCGGFAGAATGLVKAWKYGGKNVIPVALAGLLLNSSLLVTGFVKSPIGGRTNAGAKSISVIAAETRTLTTKSGRTIVTKDWTAGNVVELTDNTFDEVVNNSKVPVLVDFFAPWCGPCQEMAPVIEEIAKQYGEKAEVCRLNVGQSRETVSKFNISAIPTIMLFNRGRVLKEWVGVTSRQEIRSAMGKVVEE
jgi:thioredoxin 1